MTTKEMTIEMAAGLEARPAAMLVQVASRYESSIHIENGPVKVNAKSVMGMMSLALGEGEVIKVTADGADEEEAVTKIEEYLKTGK